MGVGWLGFGLWALGSSWHQECWLCSKHHQPSPSPPRFWRYPWVGDHILHPQQLGVVLSHYQEGQIQPPWIPCPTLSPNCPITLTTVLIKNQ